MPSEMKIDMALAKLEAGKFSFEMVNAIKSHVYKLEHELEVTRNLHVSAVRDLRVQEYANWRLENELTRLNARINTLLRANILTEKAYKKMAPVTVETGKYFDALLKLAGATLERAAAGVKSGEFRAQLVGALSKLYELFKANLPTEEEALREIRRYTIKTGQYLGVLKKHAAGGVMRTAAYLSNFRKTSP